MKSLSRLKPRSIAKLVLVALIATVLCYLLVNPRETAPERASALRQFEPAID